MGDSAVELEFDNIRKAVTTVKNIANDIGDLKRDFSNFQSSVKASDWSTEPSCMAFGESYTSALAVYSSVLAGMQADLVNYSEALDAAADSYEASDTNATAALTKLGAVDDSGFQQNQQGRTSYEQSGTHGDLNSDNPTQAADTTPDDSSGATVFPGASPTGANPANNAVDTQLTTTGSPAAGSGKK